MHGDFHREFYPTPPHLAYKIIGDYVGKVTSVLDPSAGKGDLLAPFLSRNSWRTKVYGIEQSLELCSILREKKVTILGNDFFQYGGEHYFDLVVMNPPFSNCLDHFLHAWNVCKAREIVAILPERAIGPGNKKTETLARIIEDHGKAEYLGSAFFTAERKTDARVLKVVVRKPDPELKVFFFDPAVDVSGPPESKSVVDHGLVKRDVVSTIVGQYGDAVGAIRDMLEAVGRIRGHVGMLVSRTSLDNMIKECVQKDGLAESYNDMVDSLKKGCWDALLREGEFAKYMTTSCRRDFDKFVEANTGLAFNVENILKVMESLILSNSDIFKQNIVDVFDYLTKYHKENRVHPEGWKTNDRWKVKRKFILPYIVTWERQWGMRPSWNRPSELNDIDTAMCTITGKRIEEIESINKAIDRGCKEGWPVESTFFRIKCYQKGTGHFEFKDAGLWDKFNRIACDGKKWLPEGG
jgi:SAM-dependent methyltransferase